MFFRTATTVLDVQLPQFGTTIKSNISKQVFQHCFRWHFAIQKREKDKGPLPWLLVTSSLGKSKLYICGTSTVPEPYGIVPYHTISACIVLASYRTVPYAKTVKTYIVILKTCVPQQGIYVPYVYTLRSPSVFLTKRQQRTSWHFVKLIIPEMLQYSTVCEITVNKKVGCLLKRNPKRSQKGRVPKKAP
jgi:hypothetical protein